MSCDTIEPELLAYHFALVDEDTRKRIEDHLVACPACVRAFVDVKRAIDTSEGAPRPSNTARARLRRAVATELGQGKWSWWERPLAIALAASVVLVAGATMHALTTARGTPPYALSSH
jgi:anti-sigma factor RsiW